MTGSSFTCRGQMPERLREIDWAQPTSNDFLLTLQINVATYTPILGTVTQGSNGDLAALRWVLAAR